ncbi:MAG: DUF3298 domain-containing protein [Bacteroidales bacterium]|nr:DUF3298 domain-containing protein [Bacteroidales bacterium]
MLHSNIKTTSILAIFFLSVVICSCKKNTETKENPIKFETITKNASYHLFDKEKNPNCELEIAFTYPTEYTDNNILKEIQNKFIVSALGEDYINENPQKAIEKYIKSYIDTYKELEPDFQKESESLSDDEDPGAWYYYTENLSNDIFFNQAKILSYTNRLETYTGGAHGAHAYNNHVIDLTTGKWITEEDIFVEGYTEPITKLLIEKIAELNQVDDPSKLNEIGYFGIEEIQPNGNILVNEQGITYTFNEYEIAAYAIGVTKVLLPYDEIELYLKKESPIAQLFNK